MMQKRLHLIFLLLFVTCFLTAQSTEKVLVKSFNLKGNQEVLLDFDGDVKVQAWNSDLLRVQMTIALDNGNDCLLKSLIKAGRYNLFSKLEGNEFKIFAPSLHKEVKVGNVVLTEHVSYFINVPSDILIRQAEEASTFVQSKTTP